ncbi:MAG: DMT family transporter [Proteobacteria bacterium]|nr:DMT family transporter [Pseudomonadota bacterium]
MKKGTLKADLLLLLTAAIWGFAFVAQRAGMEHVGPFLFNGLRFALGSLSLVPLILYFRKRGNPSERETPKSPGTLLAGSLAAGIILFGGASLQQVGIVYTTAGKAGFITGLYVILVPIISLKWGPRTSAGTWAGGILAAVGLYFLSINKNFSIQWGDFLVLLSAFLWAAHVLWISWLSPRMDSLVLAGTQFAVCSILSLAVAFLREPVAWHLILEASTPILYGGLCSVGIAYTLQIIAQKEAHPAHASIILSMEGSFAVLGGWILLNESMSARGLFGCLLMLLGMIISQLWNYISLRRARRLSL